MNPNSYILFAPFNSESGRTDVVNTINDFVFTPASKAAFENFTIVDDSVLEFDELLIAEFNFGPEIANSWNVRKGTPSTAFILIMDDDCELCSDSTKPHQLILAIFLNTHVPQSYLYIQVATLFLHFHLVTSSAVEVNFNEDSYTVAESDGQVNVILRIDGKFFVPVWAVVEISDGTATGGLCKYISYKCLCLWYLHQAHS